MKLCPTCGRRASERSVWRWSHHGGHREIVADGPCLDPVHDRADNFDGLELEVLRLNRCLGVIEGGDNPCTDESLLRQWAYEARVLSREFYQLSNPHPQGA